MYITLGTEVGGTRTGEQRCSWNGGYPSHEYTNTSRPCVVSTHPPSLCYRISSLHPHELITRLCTETHVPELWTPPRLRATHCISSTRLPHHEWRCRKFPQLRKWRSWGQRLYVWCLVCFHRLALNPCFLIALSTKRGNAFRCNLDKICWRLSIWQRKPRG